MFKSKGAKTQAADDMFGDDDLDADAFLNIKMENFDEEPDLFAGNEALMDKFIKVMQPTPYSLPPLQKVVTKTQYQEKSKPKTFQQTGLQSNLYNSRPNSRSGRQMPNDDISEIDMNSDTKSQVSSSVRPKNLKKNNLMQSYGSDMGKAGVKNQLLSYDNSSSLSGSMGGANRSGMPPFYPNDPRSSDLGITKRQQELLLKQEERVKIAEEWGWQKEETALLWEARAKARKGVKKQVALTAD